MEENTQIILGNSNKRFSGVTSTMIQVLEHQQKMANVVVLGKSHLPKKVRSISFNEFLKLTKHKTSQNKSIVFHARRNDEMIQALIAKKIFRRSLKIAFTSTAQRHHSRLTKWLMSQMDSIISTCKAAERFLINKADIIVPHGIDTTRYTPAENRKTAWDTLGYPGKRGIGIFGRIRPSKGIDLFVDAMICQLKHDTESTAIICGETTPKFSAYKEELQQKIQDANLTERILFIGKQPFNELPKLFRAMSIVVAASRNEGFGLTVLEALASGTPVVASEAGAWKEIITDHEHGFCIPVDDTNALQIAIQKILDIGVTEMGVNSRKHIIENYTIEQEARALTEHLLSLS